MIFNNYKTAKAMGEKRYQGRPCLKGHIDIRYVISGNCIECLKWKPTGRKVGGLLNPFKKAALENGEKYYFTGKACKAGHLSKRLTLTSRCETCHEIYAKTKRKERERSYDLKKNYGITIEQYNEMLRAQNGVCAICEKVETSLTGGNGKPKHLAVDHDHKTGKLRKLLCSNCNIGIGNLLHNSILLRKAALYCEEV